MLKLSVLEFVFRTIPEELLIIFSMYIFSSKKIDIKKLALSGLVLSVLVYLTRLLPIQPGVHTLILIPILVSVTNIINKIPLFKAVSASILSIIIMYFCEMVNVYFLVDLLHIDLETAFQNIVLKNFYGMISLFLYLLVTLAIYFVISKNKKFLKSF